MKALEETKSTIKKISEETMTKSDKPVYREVPKVDRRRIIHMAKKLLGLEMVDFNKHVLMKKGEAIQDSPSLDVSISQQKDISIWDN